jgi:hypothetical protein
MGWPVFLKKFCREDGSLIFDQEMANSRDGADDFYEAFFNWPAFYMLGGSTDILKAAKKSWFGVTEQLTKLGFVHNHFERGYDWFHIGESMIFFYGICASDPKDEEFKRFAKQFSDLYAGENSKAYDPKNNIIPGPHNGSDGVRPGLGAEYEGGYPGDINSVMRLYGLPLENLPGIKKWTDLADKGKALQMGDAMEKILGYGDVAVNLSSTSLVTNYWLYDNDPAASAWVDRYISGWAQRAEANDGIIPDNVSVDGIVGGAHDGRWYGGHYGWTWPHGFYSVTHSALVAATNSYLITKRKDSLELTRTVLKKVMSLAIRASIKDTVSSLQAASERFGVPVDSEVTLVPYRYGKAGWFDYSPMVMSQPMWLWWTSMLEEDEKLFRELISGIEPFATYPSPMRNKEEAGHEAPWFKYLTGENPNYPVDALNLALGQVARRTRLMETEEINGEQGVNIHFWQEVQPIVTEILTQLTLGAPQVLYNGGLQFARVRYYDVAESRIGLPKDVSALISKITVNETWIELVNLSSTETRNLVILGGAFGEHYIESVQHLAETQNIPSPGSRRDHAGPNSKPSPLQTEINGNHFGVSLAPFSSATLKLTMRLNELDGRFYAIEDFNQL